MKRVKCYGRQKVAQIKFEKSFIRDFFDGNKSPNSLFDQSAKSGNVHGKSFFAADKENDRANALESPTLFQNSYQENVEKSLFEEIKIKEKKDQKNKINTYGKKYAKGKRNKRKPREINCNDPKFNNYAQPRWTEFYKHPFTIEHSENNRYLNTTSKNLPNARNSSTYSYIIPCENSNIASDIQNVEINKSDTHRKSSKRNFYPGTRSNVRKQALNSLGASHTDELNSSGELFTESIKVKKRNKKISTKCSEDKSMRHLNASKDVSSNRRDLRSNRIILRDNSNFEYDVKNTERSKRKCSNMSVKTHHLKNPVNKVRNSALDSFLISYNDAIDSSGELFTASQSFKRKSNNKEVISRISTISTNNQNILDGDFKKPKSFEVNHDRLDAHRSSQNSASLFDRSRSLFSASSQSSNMLSSNENQEDIEMCQNQCENVSKSDKLDTSQLSNLENRKFGTSYQGDNLPIANQNKENTEICQNWSENISESNIFTTKRADAYQHSNLNTRKFNTLCQRKIQSFANENEEDMEECQNENENACNPESFPAGLDIYHWSNLGGENISKKIITSTPVVNRVIRLDLLTLNHSPLPCKGKTPNSTVSHSTSNHFNTCDKSVNKSISRSLRQEINDCNKSVLNNSLAKEYRLSLLLDNVSMFSHGSIKSFTVQNNIHQHAKTKRSSSLRNKSKSCIDSPHQNSEVSNELLVKNLLELCNQETIIAFDDSYDWCALKVHKIGEGSYGEVFTIAKGKSSSVLKVIPISEDPNDESYQGLRDVLSEVKISKCLSDLRNGKDNQSKNFIKLNRVSLVSGLYPSVLIKAWDTYSQAKSSYNYRPDRFDDKQVYVILDLEYGGKDMTCFVLRNAVEAECVLKQIAVSLAIAEEEFLFEHRDLHLGNILVQRNRRKNATFKLRGHDITFACHGLHVTLIDFTLSRLCEDGCIYYNDLANDVSLFNQSGDFQFDIYRFMKQRLENQWHEASLYSNVLWLNFLCVKLKEYEYSRPSTVAHKRGLEAIDSFKNQLTLCDSAFDCLKQCGISDIYFENDPNRILRLSKNSVLISRNSMQKSRSKLSICN